MNLKIFCIRTQILVLVVFFIPFAIWPDMIFMRDGRILIGKINNQNLTTVTLIDESGQKIIPKGQIIRIQFGDENQQKLELAQRRLREQQIAEQKKESLRLAQERKKTEIEAEQIAQEKKKAEDENKSIDEIQKLTEASEKAKQEALKLEQSKLETDNLTAELEEQNEIKTRSLTIRSGRFIMQSAVIQNGSQLPFVGDANLILKGGFSFNSVFDAGKVDLPVGSYGEIRYETHRHRSKTGWLHSLSYFDAKSSPYFIIGQENSVGNVFNGITNVAYSNHIESFEIKDSPKFRSGEYNLYFKLYPFTNPYFENLHFLFGGGLVGSHFEARTGIRQTDISGSFDPHSVNPMYLPHGINYRQSSTIYSEGTGYIHFGIGYLYRFFDIHALDFRVVGSGGTGAGYLNHNQLSLLDLSGTPAKSEAHVRGNSLMNGRRLDIEAGYSITIYNLRLRIFVRSQKEHLTISSAKMQTGNGLNKINSVLNQMAGGEFDLTPFLLEKMKNPSPYPEASGYLRGVGFEVGALF